MQPSPAAFRQAEAFVGWLVSDPLQLSRFMAQTGWQPQDLRAGLDSPELARAVIDHLMTDDSVLLDACAALSLPPETPARLQQALSDVPAGGADGWREAER